MIIHEKGAVKALGEAWKKGYEIVPGPNGRIAIYTGVWALETWAQDLPLAVSQALVEQYNFLCAVLPSLPESIIRRVEY